MAQKPASKRITSEFLTKPNARMVRGIGNLSAFLRPGVEKVLMKKATILARKEGRELVRAMLAIKGGGQWPTLETCLPPGSLLEQIYNVFLATTDIPSEIPVFAALHYISALLLQRDVVIEFADDTTRPDIWSVCLAESGAGKTYAQNKIKRALNANILMFGEFSSSAMFVENLSKSNCGFWAKDEFAQFLKALETQNHLLETKGYLMQCYDGEEITRATIRATITVKKPALVIFGSTVFSTIKDNITQEMLLDGFAQRFAYIVAERDPTRKPVAIYRTAGKLKELQQRWATLSKSGFHSTYKVDDGGIAAFEEAFYSLLVRANLAGVPNSFFRRILFRGFKYALIYHALLGKSSEYLDNEDFGYAARVCALNLRDLLKVLDQFQISQFAVAAEKAEAYVIRKQAEGQTTSPRQLVAGVRAVGNSRDAREILEFIIETHPNLASAINLGTAQQNPKPSKRAAA